MKLNKEEFLQLSFNEKCDYIKVRMLELRSKTKFQYQAENLISQELNVPACTINNYRYYSKSKRRYTSKEIDQLKEDLRIRMCKGDNFCSPDSKCENCKDLDLVFTKLKNDTKR